MESTSAGPTQGLIKHCLQFYSTGDRAARNGIPANEKQVTEITDFIKQGLLVFANTNKLPLRSNKLSNLAHDEFDPNNADDIVALIFEVFVEQNQNSRILHDRNALMGEIGHRAKMYLFGSSGEITNNRADGIHEKTYGEAKKRYEETLEKFHRRPF
ncbi:hypothetical protein ACMHYJ_03515 [Castellaniella hirudinis]|uniref:hypothetical protein n=1 Tax=Castellaniella hirudinis TaxID=1144617 RepID=UPI0039C33392